MNTTSGTPTTWTTRTATAACSRPYSTSTPPGRSVDIITRTAHHAGLTVGGAVCDVDGPAGRAGERSGLREPGEPVEPGGLAHTIR